MTLVLWKLTIFSQKNFFKKSGKNSKMRDIKADMR